MNKETILFFFINIIFLTNSIGQMNNYKEHREPNSRLYLRGYNYTIEKLKNGKFIKKTYYPENKNITQYITFTSKKFDVLDGLYYECYDNGEIFIKGHLKNNIREGEWLENDSKGKYINGKKEGKWLRFNKDIVREEIYYLNNELHGEQTLYDSLGQIESMTTYENGTIIKSTVDTLLAKNEIMPRYSGCEDFDGSNKEKKDCSDQKLLQYIYKNIKYPKKARKQEIEGNALVKFVIYEDGTINDIEVLRGLNKEIKEECYKLINNMSSWVPGYKDGKPVKVHFTIPIKFRLE